MNEELKKLLDIPTLDDFLNVYDIDLLLDHLGKDKNPDYEEYIDELDDKIDDLQTSLEDYLSDYIEPIRKLLLGVDDEDEWRNRKLC